MAPPPTTTRLAGTLSNAIAWSLETTVLPSNFMNGSSTGAEPVAMTKFLAVTATGAPAPLTESSVGDVKEASPVMTVTLRAFASEGDPADELGDDGVLALQERGDVGRDGADPDAVVGGVVAGEDELLGGIEERLARDAAHVEAGPPEGGALLDQRDLEAELRRAEGADIAAGAGADDHDS